MNSERMDSMHRRGRASPIPTCSSFSATMPFRMPSQSRYVLLPYGQCNQGILRGGLPISRRVKCDADLADCAAHEDEHVPLALKHPETRHMTISRAEFEERTRRLREKVKADGLDALIVFSDEYRPGHATYLTGYKPLNLIEESPQLVFLVE